MEKPKAKKSLLQKPSEDTVPEAWNWQEVSFGGCPAEAQITVPKSYTPKALLSPKPFGFVMHLISCFNSLHSFYFRGWQTGMKSSLNRPRSRARALNSATGIQGLPEEQQRQCRDPAPAAGDPRYEGLCAFKDIPQDLLKGLRGVRE